jgi:phenylacetate-CoA ligase
VTQTDSPPQQQTPTSQFLRVLRTVERYSVADLVFHQAQRVERLVRHARANVPFYANRLDAAFTSDDVLDLSRWQDVPILSSEAARTDADRLKTMSVPELAGAAVDDLTSGTGGAPFRFQRSAAAVNADAANSLRIFLDHGFDTDARFADVRIDVNRKAGYPAGALRPQWSFGHGRGDYAILDINTPLLEQVEWLLRMRPSLLFTWASNARAIALRLEEMRERLPLTALATSAEVQTSGVKHDCRRVFGLEALDILGAREVGIIAWRCHAGPDYHLTADTALIEVIRDDGAPADRGETGRLVVTPFYSFHMPFIRYATGDYATLAAGSCACGRSLPAISAIHGRGRNRLRRPDGTMTFPVVPEAALDDLIGPLQWRLVQESQDHVAVIVAPVAEQRTIAAFDAVTAAVQRALGAKFTVTVRAAETPPPSAWRKKRELFRSLVS